MKCDSVPVKVGGWEQLYPIGMRTMQVGYEVKRKKNEG